MATPDPLRLDGRRALVTGASRGIGRATAEALAAAGADVVLHYNRSAAAAGEVQEAVRALGVEALLAQADLSQDGAPKRLFEIIAERWEAVDVVVNNAGITRDGLVMMMSSEAWDDVLRVNLRAAFECSRLALRPMVRRRWGRVINVVSPAGVMGMRGAANYAAAKGGLLSFTKSLASEVGRYDITVNAVCPGLVETDLITAMRPEAREEATRRIALGRPGTPAEVAQAIRFLASPAASYVSGAMLTVDGGLMAG